MLILVIVFSLYQYFIILPTILFLFYLFSLIYIKYNDLVNYNCTNFIPIFSINKMTPASNST